MSVERIVRERPIIMSGPMVKALLAGTKTQTRRIVKKPGSRWPDIQNLAQHGGDQHRVSYSGRFNDPLSWGYPCAEDGVDAPLGAWLEWCPHGKPGERLWVRETWAPYDQLAIRTQERAGIFYRADDEKKHDTDGAWKSSMFMPRWASRILLEIAEVRVQRLQDITEADAWAEGCIQGEPWDNGKGYFPAEVMDPSGRFAVGWDDVRDWYYDLWESLHGEDSWDVNPWVWALSFKRLP